MRRTVALAVAICVAAFVARNDGLAQSGTVAQASVQWRPLIHSSGVNTDQIFPAEILALATRPIVASTPTYLGDPNGVLGVAVTTATAGMRLQVTIKVDQLSEPSSFDVVIPDANRPYEIWPKVRFDARALAGVRQSFPTTALFTLSVDGVAVGQQSRTIQIRSVNDVPFAYASASGSYQDLGFLFAAFVNESSPVIDGLLREALNVKAVPRFAGYQGAPEDVVREVFAVWNVLQRRGMRYSSIPTPSAQSQTVFSQHIRFLDEVIENEQANCADGSVLFASVLYKLGIYPALVKVPGHMFVGFFADAQRRQPIFLETTMIGEPGLNQFERTWTFKTANGYLSSRSYALFQQAITVGNKRFQEALPHLRAKAPGYMLIDIDAARRAGVSAIPRF